MRRAAAAASVIFAAVGASVWAGISQADTAAPRACSTAVATGPQLRAPVPTFTKLGGAPFGVAATGGFAFVANLSGGLYVLAADHNPPKVMRVVSLPIDTGVGATLTPDGRYLLLANGADGAAVVNVALAEAGAKDAVLGTLDSPQGGGGAIEVATSKDGSYAFVSLEDAHEIAVYRLAEAVADHFTDPSYVGAIRTGIAPVGLAVSPNGRWLYSTSEVARGGGSTQRDGTISVISIATAEHDPDDAVVSTTMAGCSPVRVVVSADGKVVWVTARESDELLAFSASKLAAGAANAELANVRVGEAPVGLALVNHDADVVVADSNRFNVPGQKSGLTVVSTARALAHRPAIIGTIRTGLFPREMALEPNGKTLLIGNFKSGTLESVNIAELP